MHIIEKNWVRYLLIVLPFFAFAQQPVIDLPYDQPDEFTWSQPEKEYVPNGSNSPIIANVSKPTMLVYRPPVEKQNGTSVVIAPGGGIYALSIESEGRKVAQWLNTKGITAFVLKYRLIPTGEDAYQDLRDIIAKDNAARVENTKKLMPYCTADALNAISHIRENAESLGVHPEKIGFMGFSGGGCVLFGVVNACEESNRPNFLVPVYPGTDLVDPIPNKFTPPTLFIAAADDQLIAASQFTEIFDVWHKAGIRTGLHLYAQGGHGFGTWRKGLPVSNWLDRFYEWLASENLVDQP